MSQGSRYRFGPFVLDVEGASLSRDGEPVDVQRRVLELIAFLASRPGELITREALMEAIWPGLHVSDAAVSQIVRRARHALDDDARDAKWIATVYGKGLRFVGAVHKARPVDGRGLFGRAEVHARVADRLAGGRRVVVVKGPGGMGKTSLAKAILAGLDGWFVDLSAVSDGLGLALRVAEALGVPLPPGAGSPIERVAGPLAGAGAGVVVLDNAEQLVDSVAEALVAWSAPRVQFLVTSRVVVDVPEAEVVELEPLGHAASVAMLRDRVRRRDPERAAALTADEVDAVVAAVDGVPLGIELAAARLALLSGAELAAVLRERATVLQTLREDLPPRHRSIEAVLEWSWAELSEPERRAAVRLAAFRGPVAVDLAARVLEDVAEGSDPLLVLAELLERSWIQSEAAGSGRKVRMLMPLRTFVRAVAAEHLPDAEAAHRAAVLGAVPAWSEIWPYHPAESVIARLQAVDAELEAVVDRTPPSDPAYAEAAVRLVLARFADGQAIPEVESLLAAARIDGYPPGIAARTLLSRSRWLAWSDAELALTLAEQSEGLAAGVGDERLVRFARVRQASSRLYLGDLVGARDLVEGVLATTREEDQVSALARRVLASIRLRTGGEVEGLVRDGLRVAVSLGDVGLQFSLRDLLGSVLIRAGRLSEAEQEIRHCLDIARQHGWPVSQVGCSGKLGTVLRDAGAIEEAEALLQWAVAEGRRLGNVQLRAYMCAHLASVTSDRGDHAAAWPLFTEARAAFDTLRLVASGLGVDQQRAVALIDVGQAERGRAMLERSLSGGERIGDPIVQWRAHYYLAVADLSDGAPADAEAHAEAGLALLTEADGEHVRASGLAYRGAARALLGRADAAGADLAEARALLKGDFGMARRRFTLLELLVRDPSVARPRLERLADDPLYAQSRELRLLAAVVAAAMAR